MANKRKDQKDDIDLGLAIMRCLYPDIPFNIIEMSYFCNCHRSRLYQIEESGMRKARGRLREMRRRDEI